MLHQVSGPRLAVTGPRWTNSFSGDLEAKFSAEARLHVHRIGAKSQLPYRNLVGAALPDCGSASVS